MKNIKSLVVIILSLMLVMVCSNVVFAAGDDLFNEANFLNVNSATTEENTSLTGNNTNNSIVNNTNTSSLTTNIPSTSNTNASTNRSVSNTNTLANTGLSNTSGTITLIVVVCGVSAIYSYKKVNDYKKL